MVPASASPDAAAFALDGDRRGVLLVHGFTGTPFEMRLLGDSLAQRGFTVRGPRLAGHGGSAAELARTGWTDWYATVERAFDELAERCDRVAVCGLSLGGLLTLELARRRRERIVGIACLAAPLWIAPWMMTGVRRLSASGWLAGLTLPKLGSDLADPAMRRRNPGTPGVPVRAVASLLDFMERSRARLGEVDRPALVGHARHDGTVPFACMEVIASGLRGPVERLVLERSKHVITLDVERELVFARVGDFVARHLG